MLVKIGYLAWLPAILRCECDSAKSLLRGKGEVKNWQMRNIRTLELSSRFDLPFEQQHTIPLESPKLNAMHKPHLLVSHLSHFC